MSSTEIGNRLLQDWVKSYLIYTDNSEPSEQFRLWTAIAGIASCLKRKCWLDWGTLTFYPNMYIVLVGPSGAARKGTAMRPVYKMLSELNVRMSAQATTRESLIRQLAQSTDSNINPNGGQMSLHSSLTIYSPELTVFLGFNNMALMSDLTDWYDCIDKWNYSTKDTKLSDNITNVWVNLFGATTPTMIRSALPSDAVGLGLTSRIIFVYSRRKDKACPITFQSAEEKELEKYLLHDLEQISMLSGAFSVTEEFINTYVDWYTETDKLCEEVISDDRFQGYIERRPNHLMKLSMIFSAARSNDMLITKQDFLGALELLTNTEKNMPLVFGAGGTNQMSGSLDKIVRFIALRKTVDYSEILTKFIHEVDERGLNQILQSLENMGAIQALIYIDEDRQKKVRAYSFTNPKYIPDYEETIAYQHRKAEECKIESRRTAQEHTD